MLPISEKYLNSLCELKTIENRVLGAGYIQKITETEVEIQFRDDSKLLIAANTLVKVSVYNERNGFKVFIGKVYIGTNDFIRLVEVVSLIDFEKREFFRINIFEKATLFKEEITFDEIENSGKPSIPILVNNISLCGAYFHTDEILSVGDKIYILLDIPENPAVFPCAVQRVDKNENRFGYGCEFVNQVQRQSDELYKYIYLKQVAYLKRLREEMIQ